MYILMYPSSAIMQFMTITCKHPQLLFLFSTSSLVQPQPHQNRHIVHQTHHLTDKQQRIRYETSAPQPPVSKKLKKQEEKAEKKSSAQKPRHNVSPPAATTTSRNNTKTKTLNIKTTVKEDYYNTKSSSPPPLPRNTPLLQQTQPSRRNPAILRTTSLVRSGSE